MPSLFASYLRVYEPLSAFDRERQLYWRRFVREGRAIAPMDGPVRQRTVIIAALGAGWTRLPDLPDEAYVLEADDTVLVCPWNLRVRVGRGRAERPRRRAGRSGRRFRATGARGSGQSGG